MNFQTSSYKNMNAQGDKHIAKTEGHEGKNRYWFYLYLGYTRVGRKAHGYMMTKDRGASVFFEGVNHFLAPQFYLYLGRDFAYNGAGFVAFVRVNLGKGAYVEHEDF